MNEILFYAGFLAWLGLCVAVMYWSRNLHKTERALTKLP